MAKASQDDSKRVTDTGEWDPAGDKRKETATPPKPEKGYMEMAKDKLKEFFPADKPQSDREVIASSPSFIAARTADASRTAADASNAARPSDKEVIENSPSFIADQPPQSDNSPEANAAFEKMKQDPEYIRLMQKYGVK